jgi:hypothetical protein
MHLVRACALAMLLLAGFCHAQDVARRDFQLPKRGTLQLDAPQSWKADLRQPPQELPPTIVFTPARGNGFQVLMTPLWPFRPDVVMPDKEKIRQTVTKIAEKAKAQAVENSLALVEIQGTSGAGYYFSATDRAPKPDEFKYMTQGMIRIGELAATFTILTNDGAGTARSDALRMVEGARHVHRDSP